MIDFLPAFDSSRAERMERNAQENTTRAAVYRRLTFALLTKSSVKLRAAVAQDFETAEALLSTAEGLRAAVEWHEAEIKLLRTAEARLLTVLSDVYPEAVEEEQPKARAVDEAQHTVVISEERGFSPPACSRQEWVQLYERLTPEQMELSSSGLEFITLWISLSESEKREGLRRLIKLTNRSLTTS